MTMIPAPANYKLIDIRSYGKRRKFCGTLNAGEGRSHMLWVPRIPLAKHAMTRHLTAVRFFPFATRKQILELMDESNHPNYWAELHRSGYIHQFRCPDNSIVYKISARGLEYLDRVTVNEHMKKYSK